MDRERFDALARLLATKGSRRGALSAILGVALFGHDPDEGLAKPGKGKGKKKGHSQGQRKGHDKGRGKGHDKGKGQGHTERDEPEESVNEEAAAAPEPEDDGPDVQAEGQGGRGKSKGKRRGKGKGKGKGRGKDKGRNDRAQNQRAEAEQIPNRCCGRLSCTKPCKGCNKQGCNYAGQDLSGLNASGANMQQVDGRGTTFSTAAKPSNWTGVNWYKACLQNSKWNGAILDGANFDQACLFDADLTGAKVNVSTNTSSAFFCRTTLWDGTVSDRDCNRGTACCPACDETHPCPDGRICCNGRCRLGDCCVVGDCPDEQCQTKACTSFNCEYTPIANGPGPLCNTICCNGICCPAGQVCVDGSCVACNAETCPNGCCDAQDICQGGNTDQACGTGGETCEVCPEGTTCVGGNCVCNELSCEAGCCSNGPGNVGVCRSGDTDQNCGTGGEQCVACPEGQTCVGGDCVCNAASCPTGCCDANGVCRTPQPNNDFCGVGGVACVDCRNGNVCNPQGRCVCNAASCPAGCCSNGRGNPGTCNASSDTTCGVNGVQCVACPDGNVCVMGTCVCNATSCPTGCCSNGPGVPGTCQTSSNATCGTGGEQCTACPMGNVCVMGDCVCNAASCPAGCCSGGPGNPGTCQPNSNDTCGVGGVQCVDCPSTDPFCNAQGQCVECLTPANCPTPPTCQIATCDAGVCGTAPLNNQQAPGCNDTGEICCNGFCVELEFGEECPICCQGTGQGSCPPSFQCVGSGACEVGGIDTCVSTGKCCRDN